MGILQKLNDAFVRTKPRTSRQVARQEVSGRLFVSPLCSTYENVFPQVRPLIDELKVVRPYGLGKNGAKLPAARTPELAALENPNEEMGWAEFADLMFAMWLTEKELNIHVWKNGRGKIYGYTVLPVGSRYDLGNGEYYFQTSAADGSIEQLPPSEVMTLRYSRNPRNISEGVSPASVVFVWTQVADLLAQYQRAYLENGAIPASVTIIRATTKAKYDEAHKELERQLKGASNQNKTIYLWEQVLETGESKAQVEVKPIQGNNSTLAIKEIMSIVHDEINKAYGVSEFILGNDSSAKYDNAELSDRQFTKRRVMPALVSFWSQFQHELDRVTGDIGYAISFDLDVPELTDRIKVKAEISEKNTANLTNLINAGATARAAVKALGLSDEWLEVAYGIYAEKQRQQNVAASTAVMTKSGQNPDTLTSDKVGKSGQNPDKREPACTHCHYTHDNLPANYEPTFSEEEQGEQEIYDSLMALVDDAVADLTEEEEDKLKKEEKDRLRAVIIATLITQANQGAKDGVEQIVLQVTGEVKQSLSTALQGNSYEMSDQFVAKVEARTDKLIAGLTDEARVKVSEALKINREEGRTAQQIAKALKEALPKYRAEMIARNETVYALRAGHLEADKKVADEYGLKLRKTWKARPGACDICAAMDGQTVNLSDAFPDSVEGVDKDGKKTTFYWGHTSWNDNGELTDAHVNCRCYFHTEVIHD